MTYNHSSFKRINPFRRSSQIENGASHSNRRNFSEKFDAEARPKLFSPPEVVDKELKDVQHEQEINEDESSLDKEDRVTPFIDEFSSMLNDPSQSYPESKDKRRSSWQEQDQQGIEEQLPEPDEKETTTGKPGHDSWRRKMNPFINEFTSMLEVDSSKELEEKDNYSSLESMDESTDFDSNHQDDYNSSILNENLVLEKDDLYEEEFTRMLEDDKSPQHEDGEWNEGSIGDFRFSEKTGEDERSNNTNEEVKEEKTFTQEFTSMLEDDTTEHGKDTQRESHHDEPNKFAINEKNQDDEFEEDNLSKQKFTSLLEEEFAEDHETTQLDEAENEHDCNMESMEEGLYTDQSEDKITLENSVYNDEIHEDNPFKEEFTSMLKSPEQMENESFESENSYVEYSGETDEVKDPIPHNSSNLDESGSEEWSEAFYQSDVEVESDDCFEGRFQEEFEEDINDEVTGLDEYEKGDYAESLQDEMLSMLEETDNDPDSSLQFMEDVIEYFDEVEDNREFPLERFLKFLMKVYCSEVEYDPPDYKDAEEQDKTREDKVKDSPENFCKEEASTIVKLPVTLASIKLEIDILDTINIPTQITNLNNIKWSISSLKSSVLLPSSTIFFKGIVDVELEYEGQDSKSSIQTTQIPIKWEKVVDVTWMTSPELAESYEKEYVFNGKDSSIHLESYQKLAHEIDHDLKDVHCIWHYNSNQANQLQLNGMATLLIELSQDQYISL
ncbi:hypothetical protein [Pontibacillus sp. HMF3514]|uniref:hypothetical protein n=1 Tax=Pontibacillus sp. HMF3514 TaxID=2692425 RepID=UPI00131FA6E3|nr:hypothetical protein [Pontibacillus sp. HMF3514]QHE52621.1 hypothetical protein GS400_11515 [Pontibacillus sp. HMF3514]